MSRLRTAGIVFIVIALAWGYGASQWAYFTGSAVRYAELAGIPAIKAVALLFLVASAISMFFPEKEGESP